MSPNVANMEPNRAMPVDAVKGKENCHDGEKNGIIRSYFIIQQRGNAIWALLRRQLTLISLITGFSKNQNMSRLPPAASIWFNLDQTGSIIVLKAASRLVQLVQSGLVASKFESGRHNDIIITSWHKSLYPYTCIKSFPSPPPIVIEQQNQLAHPDLSSLTTQ